MNYDWFHNKRNVEKQVILHVHSYMTFKYLIFNLTRKYSITDVIS